MTKFTQKQLKAMAKDNIAIDLTYKGTQEDYKEVMEKESYLTQIGYASGIYGCNGLLFKGAKTGSLYVIHSRTTAICIYH